MSIIFKVLVGFEQSASVGCIQKCVRGIIFDECETVDLMNRHFEGYVHYPLDLNLLGENALNT